MRRFTFHRREKGPPDLWRCRLCGSEMTLYFYPRPGPAPGNMRVCTNDDCPASIKEIRRSLGPQA